jgi:hypothetical protein
MHNPLPFICSLYLSWLVFISPKALPLVNPTHFSVYSHNLQFVFSSTDFEHHKSRENRLHLR